MLQEECEFGNRCKNSDKCYRCFNQKLLKLPEEKKFKRKKQTYDYSKANADDSWKDLEQQVADKLNYVPTIKEARRSRRSGALEFETGDVVDSILHTECKERKGNELKQILSNLCDIKDTQDKIVEILQKQGVLF